MSVGYNTIKTEFNVAFDAVDPWGSAISWAFSACDLLTDMGATVPAEAEFRQAPAGSETEAYEYETLKELLDDGYCTLEDLQLFVRVLIRYLDLCKAKGLDY